jgi:hypothetical protein
MKLILSLLLFTTSFPATAASGDNFTSMCSPKLRKFVEDHQEMGQVISNAIRDAFSQRSLQVYYFYSDNETVPPASHYYPDQSTVAVLLLESQDPIDECITLLYEVVNSKGENRFQELCDAAKNNTISRTNFAYEVLNMEFQAAKETQKLLRKVKFSKSEISKSTEYSRFALCPDSYAEFLAYTEKISLPKRNPIAEMELQFDAIKRSR